MNIFVGNLSFRATNGDLEQLFGQYGTVDSAAIINDRDTGRSRVSVSSKCRTPQKETRRSRS